MKETYFSCKGAEHRLWDAWRTHPVDEEILWAKECSDAANEGG